MYVIHIFQAFYPSILTHVHWFTIPANPSPEFNLSAQVFTFDPYITVHGTVIRYKVVNLNTLTTDLRIWNNLYLAGRMQHSAVVERV
jgi:hypothetical protein